jgi:hypothetical protein
LIDRSTDTFLFSILVIRNVLPLARVSIHYDCLPKSRDRRNTDWGFRRKHRNGGTPDALREKRESGVFEVVVIAIAMLLWYIVIVADKID